MASSVALSPVRYFCFYSTPSSIPRLRICARFSTTMAITTATIIPAIIVGGGRVGRSLQGMGNGRDVLISREQQVPADFDGPIFVCTRNDDLDAVLEATPSSRWSDMVFFQNGMLDPWFESRGLGDANQVLAYFAVSKLGESPTDGKTDTNPEGLTAAFGKWASAVAARLHSGGLSCKVLQKEAFQKQMLEKLIWISAFMLVGARHLGATVGVVEKDYRSEVTSLIAELESAAAAERGITFDDGMVERLCAYSRAVAHFPTAVKEENFIFPATGNLCCAAGPSSTSSFLFFCQKLALPAGPASGFSSCSFSRHWNSLLHPFPPSELPPTAFPVVRILSMQALATRIVSCKN